MSFPFLREWLVGNLASLSEKLIQKVDGLPFSVAQLQHGALA
jgi:hypothetical protein